MTFSKILVAGGFKRGGFTFFKEEMNSNFLINYIIILKAPKTKSFNTKKQWVSNTYNNLSLSRVN
jgi:hypothetical protein